MYPFSSQNSTSGCLELTTLAERELSAFFRAVTELFGPQQAELSAEDWLDELVKIDGLPASIREWRAITAKVAAMLANRLHSPSLSAVTH